MLNKIHIHKTRAKTFWFRSSHCAKVLGKRPDNFLRQVNIRKINSQNYISEETFRQVFKDNKVILDQLEYYKKHEKHCISTVGNDKLSLVLSYLRYVSYKDRNISPPNLKPLNGARFYELALGPNPPEEVLLSIAIIYRRIFFYDSPNEKLRPEECRNYCLNTFAKNLLPYCFCISSQILLKDVKPLIKEWQQSYLYEIKTFPTELTLEIPSLLFSPREELRLNTFEYPILTDKHYEEEEIILP